MNDKRFAGVMLYIEEGLAFQRYFPGVVIEILRHGERAAGIEHHFAAIGQLERFSFPCPAGVGPAILTRGRLRRTRHARTPLRIVDPRPVRRPAAVRR